VYFLRVTCGHVLCTPYRVRFSQFGYSVFKSPSLAKDVLELGLGMLDPTPAYSYDSAPSMHSKSQGVFSLQPFVVSLC